MQEQQQEQQDKLSELIDKVNDQARDGWGDATKPSHPPEWIHSQDSTITRASASTQFPLSVRDLYPGFPVVYTRPLESMVP